MKGRLTELNILIENCNDTIRKVESMGHHNRKAIAAVYKRNLAALEVNLKTMKVVQSYGKYNSLTKRHAEILRLVNSNLNKIAELV